MKEIYSKLHINTTALQELLERKMIDYKTIDLYEISTLHKMVNINIDSMLTINKQPLQASLKYHMQVKSMADAIETCIMRHPATQIIFKEHGISVYENEGDKQ